MQFALLIHHLTNISLMRTEELQGKVLVSVGIRQACMTCLMDAAAEVGVCHIAIFICSQRIYYGARTRQC